MRKFLDGALIAGAAGFILVLAVSAAFDRTIIVLHIFQALMYLAVIALVSRRNRWGYFLAVAIAGFWNYTNLFVTNFFVSGLRALEHLLTTGQLVHADQLVAVAAVFFHLVMIAAGVARIVQTSRKALADLGVFLFALVASTAYFAACMALFQPRYLQLFPRLLHPHGWG
ncbi:hypothetical protein [Phenylobacterium sp.]|uniref:hypothetical protein n=1 Tax=Phenylobacterium sp. TaxID=1871053 RepID=UPI002F418828